MRTASVSRLAFRSTNVHLRASNFTTSSRCLRSFSNALIFSSWFCAFSINYCISGTFDKFVSNSFSPARKAKPINANPAGANMADATPNHITNDALLDASHPKYMTAPRRAMPTKIMTILFSIPLIPVSF